MKIAIFTGPTGGHFFPALAFAECLHRRRPGTEILFVTGRRAQSLVERTRKELNLRFEWIPDFPFPRPQGLDFPVRLAGFLIKLVHAFLKTEGILSDFKPDLSVGFGSYASFPGLLISQRKGIPTLIHEQNRKMGWANARLAGRASRVALSFEMNGSSLPTARVRVTGLPLRASLIEEAEKRRRPDRWEAPGKVRILLVGGSQGSRTLNRLWERMLGLLSDEEKSRLAVIHITGEEDWERFNSMYPAIGIEAAVFAYHERMEELYSRADLAVTRAGAGTLFELALFGLAAVVFPYPYAEGHQEMNARHFEEAGAVMLLFEEKCTPGELKKKILALVDSSELRMQLSSRLRRLARPDAGEKLMDSVEELLSQRGVCLT